MNVNDAKHQARLAEWKTLVAQCRSSGLPVKQWCAENGRDPSTYYRWEREIFGRIKNDSGKKTEELSPAARSEPQRCSSPYWLNLLWLSQRSPLQQSSLSRKGFTQRR